MSASPALDAVRAVVTLADLDRREVTELLARFGARLVEVAAHDGIPGSYWGDTEAGLVGDTVYARGREHLVRDVAPQLRTLSPERIARIRIDNNAALLARRIYLTDLELFDRVWERESRDLRRTIERVILLAKDADDPYAAVKKWLGEP